MFSYGSSEGMVVLHYIRKMIDRYGNESESEQCFTVQCDKYCPLLKCDD